MATFYVLPSRPLVGRRVAESLGKLFPGLAWGAADWPDLAELIGATVMGRPDVYVLYREDVPDGMALGDALMQEFGAEPGDEVVEVALGARLSEVGLRRWQAGAEVRPAA